jgi:hypothetical protein
LWFYWKCGEKRGEKERSEGRGEGRAIFPAIISPS